MQIAIASPRPSELQVVPHFSPAEYLAQEELTELKNEYFDGEVIPMTGGTTKHNRICLNLIIALDKALRDLNYEIFSENVRLWIPDTKIFTYPDVMIIADQIEYYQDRTDTITNPQVIFEVLSPSTQSYDCQDKFEYYRTISTFKEYILIDQNRQRIQQFSKISSKQWTFRDYDSEDTHILLTSLEFLEGLEISIQDIYHKVSL